MTQKKIWLMTLSGHRSTFIKYLSLTPLFLCLMLAGPHEVHAQPNKPALADKSSMSGLFGSHETRSGQLIAFKKWNAMLARHKADLKKPPLPDTICRKTATQKCYQQTWRDLLDFLKDKPANQQITEINLHMNKAPYITDIINWGVSDYWASLRQFFKKDGDCEDYAIAKYMSLKKLGFDADMMRIVVVQDTNLDVPHAVLVVSLDGTRLILDNQISYVAKEKAVLHYRPYYSINEKSWWLHRM